MANGAANAHRIAVTINIPPTAVLSSKRIAPFQKPLYVVIKTVGS